MSTAPRAEGQRTVHGRAENIGNDKRKQLRYARVLCAVAVSVGLACCVRGCGGAPGV